MHTRSLNAGLLVAIGTLASGLWGGGARAQAPSGWQEFHSPEGRFKIRVPAARKHTTGSVQVPEGAASQHFFTVKHQGNAYITTYADYPAGYYLRLGAEKMLDTDRNDFLKATNARLTAERRYRIGGSPGREFRFTGPDGLTGICSAYLVGFRMYMICSVSRSGGSVRDMEQFQESFRLARSSRK